VRRQLRLQLRAGKALYDKVCKKAGEAFAERRFQDALRLYEDFAKENPEVYPEEIRFRIKALKEYIEEHIEKAEGSQPPS